MHQELIPPMALTIRQPWAWLIVHGFKDIENRTWSTAYRGRLGIHAGKGCTKAEYRAAMEFALAIHPELVDRFEEICYPALIRGALIGEVTLTGCVAASPSRWFTGKYGWLLEQPVSYPQPIPLKGRLGLFRHGLMASQPSKAPSEPLQASC
jgi:hypothetical protein